MNVFYTMLCVALAFSLGVFTGEMYAPISGVTVQALSRQADALEQRLVVAATIQEELARSIHYDGGAGRAP